MVVRLLLSTFVALAPMTLQQRVQVLVNRDVDFSQHESFAWRRDQKVPDNLANHIRLVVAVQNAMRDAGCRIDTQSPDLRVKYLFEIAEVEVEVARKDYENEYETSTEALPTLLLALLLELLDRGEKVERMLLTVQLYEEETGFLVWQVRGRYPWSPDRAEKIINAAIADLFRHHSQQTDTDGRLYLTTLKRTGKNFPLGPRRTDG